MTGPSPSPRRISTPSWLDLRLVAGVVVVVASVIAGALVFSRADQRFAIVAASRDLSAGTVLQADDLTVSRVQVPDHGAGVYLADPDDVIGKRLTRDVSAGELLPSAAVAVEPARTTVTIPLQADAAPSLRPGERIEIWLSSPSCSSLVVLPSVTVQDVSADAGGSFTSGTGGQDVVVSIDPRLAGRVVSALAIQDAQLRAGILVGPSTGPASATVPGSDGVGVPADLAACARSR